jgi:DNA-directed RNA polymerase III subunit RPC1
MLNDKLAEQDAALCGYSDKFKEMLTKFLEDRIKMLRSTRRALQLDQDHVGGRDSSIEEGIAADISGISEKQLQVCIIFACTKASLICKNTYTR